MRYYETERECIDCFREEYYFLSNFYPAIVRYDGITYLNAEAAFQAQKCTDPADRLAFADLSAEEAKKRGRKVELRADWDDVKIAIMREVVRAKFTQNRFLAEWLLKTDEKPLIEGNTWHDAFWGFDLKKNVGENHLGIILMELRDDFRKNGLPDGGSTVYKQFGPVDHISVVFGDLTQSDCMCIVNAANSTLLGGGGVDGAIHMAAGRNLLEACRELKGYKAGKAKITEGYDLKAKYVIHTVGPRYSMENHEELLKQAYCSCLDLARQHGITGIAFPAVSTGLYMYPKQEAAEVAVQTAREWLRENPDTPMEIFFYCVDSALYDFFCMYTGKIDNNLLEEKVD